MQKLHACSLSILDSMSRSWVLLSKLHFESCSSALNAALGRTCAGHLVYPALSGALQRWCSEHWQCSRSYALQELSMTSCMPDICHSEASQHNSYIKSVCMVSCRVQDHPHDVSCTTTVLLLTRLVGRPGQGWCLFMPVFAAAYTVCPLHLCICTVRWHQPMACKVTAARPSLFAAHLCAHACAARTALLHCCLPQ